MNLNRVYISGNLVRDFEKKNEKLAKTTIAYNREYYKNNEKIVETSYFDIICLGEKTEIIAKRFKKGDHVIIEGTLKENKWINKEGKKRSKVEIIIYSINLIDHSRNFKNK